MPLERPAGHTNGVRLPRIASMVTEQPGFRAGRCDTGTPPDLPRPVPAVVAAPSGSDPGDPHLRPAAQGDVGGHPRPKLAAIPCSVCS